MRQPDFFGVFLCFVIALLSDYFGAKVVGLQPLQLNSRKPGNSQKSLKSSIEEMDGAGFGGLEKRALGDIEGIGFGGLEKRSRFVGGSRFYKRALGDIEGTGFDDLEKRALEDIEGTGFGGLEKRALGDIEGTGFGGLEKRFVRTGKRALDALDQKGFNGLDKRSLKIEPGILRFFNSRHQLVRPEPIYISSYDEV